MYFFATASTLDIAEPEGYSEEALDGIVLHLMEEAEDGAGTPRAATVRTRTSSS